MTSAQTSHTKHTKVIGGAFAKGSAQHFLIQSAQRSQVEARSQSICMKNVESMKSIRN